jgi:RimJ/RimL family protein N-acetyltransferase
MEDLPAILSLYEEARQFMHRSGNLTQWTGGYPGADIIMADIRHQYSHVAVGDDAGIGGVFSLIPGEDPTYAMIEEGRWLNDRPYAAVHRLAISRRGSGLAACCLDWCFAKFGNIRADTHRDNLPMQRLLVKNGFTYCGIIYVADGTPRLAYQKAD